MDSKLIRTRAALPKPLLLKDYLLDDLSSCSSNGFKSFPRRQCCTSVRFIHEFDLKNKNHQQKLLTSNKSSSKSPLSALRSVITAVKRLPFSSAAKSPENKYSKTVSFLPRSLSRKILKKSGFWKRKSDRKEIGGWKPFDQVKEDSEPSDRFCSSDSKSNSWSGSDFTVSGECSSGNFPKEVNLNLPERTTNDVVVMEMELVSDEGVGVTNDDVSKDSTTSSDDGCASTNSSTNTKGKQWSSDEKEQLSPVSVLDCPFDDDYDQDQDQEVSSSSSFRHRLARMEGAKKKLMMKLQRFECLAKLEPVNLATRFALQSDSDSESSGSPLPHASPIDDTFTSDFEEEEEESDVEDKAVELLQQVKATCNLKLNSEKLVLDFLMERIGINGNGCDEEAELVEQVENWINEKQPRGMFLEWKVQRNRQAYYDDVEKGGQWKTLDQEKQDLALDLETQVFAALLNEVLLEI